MIAPVDYSINVPSPVDRLAEGMALGQSLRARQQQMGLAANQEQRDQTTFNDQQAALVQQQAAMQAQQDAALALHGDMMGLAGKVADGSATFQDFAQLSLAHPDVAAQLNTVWDGQSAERKKNDVAGLFKAGAAIKAGRPEIATQMLEDYATAAENSGQKTDADLARATAGIIKANPAAGLTQIGLLLHGVDEEAAKALFGDSPGWRMATPEEAAKYGAQFGQINDKTGEFKAEKPPSNGITITNPDGSTTQIGGPAGQTGPNDISYSPKDINTVLDAIEAIKTDPALGKVTGPIMGGGGNDVENLNVAQRAYYGSAGLSLIEKIGQLQSTTWLAARQMLKGGGAITDYESRKAEAAMARLSRVKNDADFRAALTDLEDAIRSGQEKLQAAGKGTATPSPSAASEPPQAAEWRQKYGVSGP